MVLKGGVPLQPHSDDLRIEPARCNRHSLRESAAMAS